MPAAVEERMFVSGRGIPAWHDTEGAYVVEGTMTLPQVLSAANLAGWNVRKVELEHNGIRVPGQFVTVRDNPVTGVVGEPLAIVGNKYKVMGIEQAFGFTQDIINIDGQWDTAGSLHGGLKVFGTMLLSREFTLDPFGANDQTVLYVGVATSFDGTMQTTFFITMTRVVCQNTLTMALHGNERTYKVRHTANAEGRLEDARKSLNLAHANMDALEIEAKAMFETECSRRKFDEIVKTLVEVPEPDVNAEGKVTNQTGITRRENLRDLLHDVHNAGTNDNVRGTAWGAWQSLVEFEDYYRESRGENQDENRVLGQFAINQSDKWKTETMGLVKELCEV